MSDLREINEESSKSFATRLLQAGYDVDKAFTPFLCLFGALGNSLSIALFSLNRKYRNQSSSYYLSALAISDTGFLVNLFMVWLESVYGGVITSSFLCRLVMYLGQVTCFISVYVMVGFSFERYIAVCNPLSRQQICTKSRTKKRLICVTCAALLLFSYAWFIAQLIEIRPRTNRQYVRQNRSRMVNPLYENISRASTTNMENSTIDVDLENIHWSEEATYVLLGNVSSTTQENFKDFYPTKEAFAAKLLPLFNSSNQTTKKSKVKTSKPKPLRYFYCSVPRKYRRISQIANYFDTVVTLIIPFFLISACNLKIVLTLRKLRKDQQLFQSRSSALLLSNKVNTTLEITQNQSTNQIVSKLHSSRNDNLVERSYGRSRIKSSICINLHTSQPATLRAISPNSQCAAETRTTKRLLLVSSVFLLLNLPLHVIRCAQFFQTLTGSNEEKDVFAALQPWANLLFNTNFGLNFLLYCASGKHFRQSVKHTVFTIFGKFTGKQSAKFHRPTQLQHQQKTVVMLKYKRKDGDRIGGSLRRVKTNLSPETCFKRGPAPTTISNTI